MTCGFDEAGHVSDRRLEGGVGECVLFEVRGKGGVREFEQEGVEGWGGGCSSPEMSSSQQLPVLSGRAATPLSLWPGAKLSLEPASFTPVLLN